jgi:hypothetical protein
MAVSDGRVSPSEAKDIQDVLQRAWHSRLSADLHLEEQKQKRRDGRGRRA